jgi:hypothetical protein
MLSRAPENSGCGPIGAHSSIDVLEYDQSYFIFEDPESRSNIQEGMYSIIALRSLSPVIFVPTLPIAARFKCVIDQILEAKVIFRDGTLSQLDNEIAKAHHSTIDTAGSHRNAIRNAQRSFLRYGPKH